MMKAEQVFSDGYTKKPGRNNKKPERDRLDFYPTPAYATLAMLDLENFENEIFDGTCGDGELIFGCKAKLPKLKYFASDISDYGFGKAGVDFLKLPQEPSYDNIVMNPPYGIIKEILPIALKMARKKLAILAPISTMESESRYEFFTQNPPTTVWLFSERVTMFSRVNLVKKQYENEELSSGVMSMAWFIWDKEKTDHSRIKLIPPGQKQKYAEETAQIRTYLNKRFKDNFYGKSAPIS